MVQICALASGSNGNCYYVGNKHDAILIDAGISNLQLLQRMKRVGLSIHKVRAIFISHEHTDHIKGLRVISQKHNIHSFVTRKTFKKIHNDLRPDYISYFAAGEMINVGNIRVHSFRKNHDAVDPVSFRVQIDGLNVAVLTDLGKASHEVVEHLHLCNAAFLETNYDSEMLRDGRYPAYLKQRIASGHGHLSNSQAFELVKSLNGAPLKTIVLSHISAENNSIDRAMDAFNAFGKTHLIVPTSREAASKLIRL